MRGTTSLTLAHTGETVSLYVFQEPEEHIRKSIKEDSDPRTPPSEMCASAHLGRGGAISVFVGTLPCL